MTPDLAPLDIDYARHQFPMLGEAPKDGTSVFMDNAGGSLMLRGVVDRLTDYLYSCDVQHGASYPTSQEASRRYAAAREVWADAIGANDPEEVVFGPSSSILLSMLSQALAGTLEPGDEIVVTRLDHEANVTPWLRWEERGVVIRYWDPDPISGALTIEGLESVLGERTRYVAFTHCSNLLGRIHDVAALTARIHAAGARAIVDGVAFAPHRALRLAEWGVDFYVFSLYKVYGPHHAILYGRREAFEALSTLNHFFVDPARLAPKLELGNANYELSVGSSAVVDYLGELGRRALGASASDDLHPISTGFEAIARHEATLAERLLAYLRQVPEIEVVGPETSDPEVRVPTISFLHKQRASSQIVSSVDRDGIGIRHGHFYSIRYTRALELDDFEGVVRVSLVHYNTVDEVDRLIASLGRAFDWD